MKTMIENYRNIPGEHCGSTAMRNLLHFYCGLDLDEAVVFGLGSGLDLLTIAYSKMDPPLFMSGRSISMEADACKSLGIDYQEQPEFDDAKAWEDVRQEILAGRPTMLSGDIFFLDYRNYKVRFPAHRFVLLGFDDERSVVHIADRVDREPQACSYGALARSRNPESGISTFNLWGKFHDIRVTRNLEDACRSALRTAAARMNGKDTSQADLIRSVLEGAEIAAGLDGLRYFRRWVTEILPGHEKASFMASYFYQSIEKFGSGGGNFRRLYARFLDWAQRLVPDTVDGSIPAACQKSADQWTALANTFKRIADTPENKAAEWKTAGDTMDAIIELESGIFSGLREY